MDPVSDPVLIPAPAPVSKLVPVAASTDEADVMSHAASVAAVPQDTPGLPEPAVATTPVIPERNGLLALLPVSQGGGAPATAPESARKRDRTNDADVVAHTNLILCMLIDASKPGRISGNDVVALTDSVKCIPTDADS